MSIIKFKDLSKFDNATIEMALRADNVEEKRAINSPKYLIIDWRGVKPEDVDVKDIDIDLLREYVEPRNINNKAVLMKLTNIVDLKDPEFLWIWLVDEGRMSNQTYLNNTESENYDMLMKNTKFRLPLADQIEEVADDEALVIAIDSDKTRYYLGQHDGIMVKVRSACMYGDSIHAKSEFDRVQKEFANTPNEFLNGSCKLSIQKIRMKAC